MHSPAQEQAGTGEFGDQSTKQNSSPPPPQRVGVYQKGLLIALMLQSRLSHLSLCLVCRHVGAFTHIMLTPGHHPNRSLKFPWWFVIASFPGLRDKDWPTSWFWASGRNRIQALQVGKEKGGSPHFLGLPPGLLLGRDSTHPSCRLPRGGPITVPSCPPPPASGEPESSLGLFAMSFHLLSCPFAWCCCCFVWL